MNHFRKVFLYIFAFSILLCKINAQLPGNWPAVDKPPPPVSSWTALVNMAKVPKAPLEKGEGDCKANNFCDWSCNQCTRNDTDVVTCPNQEDWGLTFDDGPTEFTDALLDYLQSKNIKATFFVIGSRVIERPEVLKKAVNNGHQIGIHTWSHPLLTTQSNEEIIAELKWTELAIKTAVGLTPKYMRPPFGNYDDRVRQIATQLGYKVVVWDKDTNDWMMGEKVEFNAAWIEGNFSEWVKEPSNTGHISLEHDLYKQSAERAPIVVPIVLNAGYTIKPVAACLNDLLPYKENVPLTTPTPTSTPTPTPTPTSTQPDTNDTTDNISGSTNAAIPQPSAISSSNSIHFTNNNNNLLLLVLLIIGSFMMI